MMVDLSQLQVWMWSREVGRRSTRCYSNIARNEKKIQKLTIKREVKELVRVQNRLNNPDKKTVNALVDNESDFENRTAR
jgi:hypothetical protein